MYRKITSTIIVYRVYIVSIFLLCENDDECTLVVRRGIQSRIEILWPTTKKKKILV